MTRLVPDIKGADPGAAGLLVECRGQTPESLQVAVTFVFPLSCLLQSIPKVDSVKHATHCIQCS